MNVHGYHNYAAAEYVLEFRATPDDAVRAFAAATSAGASATLCKDVASGPEWELRIVSIRGTWFGAPSLDDDDRAVVESVMAAVREALP